MAETVRVRSAPDDLRNALLINHRGPSWSCPTKRATRRSNRSPPRVRPLGWCGAEVPHADTVPRRLQKPVVFVAATYGSYSIHIRLGRLLPQLYPMSSLTLSYPIGRAIAYASDIQRRSGSFGDSKTPHVWRSRLPFHPTDPSSLPRTKHKRKTDEATRNVDTRHRS